VFEIDNCDFYNDHNSCIGIGLRAGFTLKIRNCRIVSTSLGVTCHDGSVGGNEQRIELINNIIEVGGGRAVLISDAYQQPMTALFVGNALFAGGTLPPVFLGGTVVLDSHTCNNNITITT
jgi:hypothetical protein